MTEHVNFIFHILKILHFRHKLVFKQCSKVLLYIFSKVSPDFNFLVWMKMKHFIWCKSPSMGDLKLNIYFFITARQNVTWLGFSWLALYFMSCACKGYTPTSEIKSFDFNVKQNILNDKKRWKRQNGSSYCRFSSFQNDIKMLFFRFLPFQQTELSVHVILLMLVWHKDPENFR